MIIIKIIILYFIQIKQTDDSDLPHHVMFAAHHTDSYETLTSTYIDSGIPEGSTYQATTSQHEWFEWTGSHLHNKETTYIIVYQFVMVIG